MTVLLAVGASRRTLNEVVLMVLGPSKVAYFWTIDPNVKSHSNFASGLQPVRAVMASTNSAACTDNTVIAHHAEQLSIRIVV